jgi:hypothetical protein
VDEDKRECLAIHVARWIRAAEVIWVLTELPACHLVAHCLPTVRAWTQNVDRLVCFKVLGSLFNQPIIVCLFSGEVQAHFRIPKLYTN